jgi:arylsulfatase A-like enzyme
MKQRGIRSNALVEFVDVYPSLAELAGLPLPGHLEGLSFKPLLDDPQRPWKAAAFSQYPRNQAGQQLMGYSMRTDRYRLTLWVHRNEVNKVASVELYDHATDPQENTNIADRPEHAALVEQLTTQLRAGWRANHAALTATHSAR